MSLLINRLRISFEPCALNVDLQHFLPNFNKISLLYGYPWKKGLGWKEAQRQGDFMNNFSTYTYVPQNIYTRSCKCIWEIFTLVLCKCKTNMYIHCNMISVSDLHLHWIYTLYIQLLTVTCTTLVWTSIRP